MQNVGASHPRPLWGSESLKMHLAIHWGTARTLWLLLSYSLTILGAPAWNPLQPSLFAPSNTNLTSFRHPSNLLTLPTNSTPSLGAIEHWLYAIPSTTLMFRMAAYPAHEIDRAALGRTILAAQGKIRAHIKAHGDGELWEDDDPFEIDAARTGKCFIGIASPSTTAGAGPYKLRYSTLADIFQGMWNFMYLARHECEIIFKVEDRARETRREGEELVGLGKLLRG